MKSFGLYFCLNVLIAISESSDTVTYDGHQLWSVAFSDSQWAEFQNDFKDKEFDIWNVKDGKMDLLVNKNDSGLYESYLKSMNVTYNSVIKNVQQLIHKENRLKQQTRKTDDFFNTVPSLSEIEEFMDELVEENPKRCSLHVIGTTLNNNKIKMLKISSEHKTATKILIEGGVHAREWTGIMTVLYLMNEITDEENDDAAIFKNHHWYIIPVLNPDGFDYSKKVNRLWKKNRRRFGADCYGVDINSNYAINWCQNRYAYAISPCSEEFCGPVEFSEPESNAIKNLIEGTRFFAYISVQSYGSQVIVPWSFSGDPGHDNKDHNDVAFAMAAAMRKVHNERYVPGTVRQLQRPALSGTSTDWAYQQDVRYPLVLRTSGSTYIDTPSDMYNACEEVYAGIKALSEILG